MASLHGRGTSEVLSCISVHADCGARHPYSQCAEIHPSSFLLPELMELLEDSVFLW
jgi:hypothetical protein